MDTLYIESAVAKHPKTGEICQRFSHARQIVIEKYTELFNARQQDFRAQKQSPALILAKKHGKRIHETPPGYHVGGTHNYYFSHMLNCVYDCRYCFLQGMYSSANYVVFVNSNDFFDDITATTSVKEEPCWFFSGYDCDSLALDPITGFVDECLDYFEQNSQAWLELRTKSTQIRSLLKRQAIPNVVVAYSLSPEAIVQAEEHGTPSLKKRLSALKQLQQQGWKIGLRFDPLLYANNFEAIYGELFDEVFEYLDMPSVHSISLGVFRLPKAFHKNIVKLYPESRLLSAPLEYHNNLMTYPPDIEANMRRYCESQLARKLRPDQFYPCS